MMKFVMTRDGLVQFDMTETVKETVKDNLVDIIKDTTVDILVLLKDAILDTIGGITLIGAGLLILFKVVGYDDGHKWAGVLILANVLVKYILGGL